MPALLERCFVTVDAQKYVFITTKGLYDGAIATNTGVSVAGNSEAALPVIPVSSLLRAGVLLKQRAFFREGTRVRTLTVYFEKSKAATVGSLVNASFSYQSISAAGVTGTTSGTIRSIGAKLDSTSTY
jgi:hypothetical protein